MTTALDLPVEGQIPSLAGATGWLQSEALSPERLRGKPVLVQFWTSTCINWIRTLPYMRSWFEVYGGEGLSVLGVHTPEFEVERSVDHVRWAAREMGIDFAVAVDSNYEIWDAFANRYWPALYFADSAGRIRHHHFGEGDYYRSEQVIQLLLEAAGVADARREPVGAEGRGIEAAPDWDQLRSAETYIGYERSANRQPDTGRLSLNGWALAGDWTIEPEAGVLNAAGGRIAYRFKARDLHMVLAPGPEQKPVRFRVLLDGAPPGRDHGVDVDAGGNGGVDVPRLYQLIRLSGPVSEHTFEIAFQDPGVRAYVFTFG